MQLVEDGGGPLRPVTLRYLISVGLSSLSREAASGGCRSSAGACARSRRRGNRSTTHRGATAVHRGSVARKMHFTETTVLRAAKSLRKSAWTTGHGASAAGYLESGLTGAWPDRPPSPRLGPLTSTDGSRDLRSRRRRIKYPPRLGVGRPPVRRFAQALHISRCEGCIYGQPGLDFSN